MKNRADTEPAKPENFQLNMSSIVERSGTMNRVRSKWRESLVILGVLVALCSALAPRATAQPVNDNFTNATFLFGPLGSVFGSTVNASQELNEPIHWNFFPRPGASQHSAWYRWVAPATGFISFDTGGSSYDTVLSAYTGADLPSLIRIASDDDGLGFSLQSLVTFFASAGTEYFIAVDGYDYGEAFGTRSGFFFLNWSGAGGTNALGPTEVQFSAANFQAYENTPGFITITVVSGGGFTTGGTVDYSTADGTAIAGVDYLSVSNTLAFAAGENFKTFTIPLLDNTLQHSNKTILLTLSNPTGEVLLGGLSNSVATILDDETPPFVSPAGEFNIVWPDPPLQGSAPPPIVGLPFGFGFLFSSFPNYVVTENETATFASGPSGTTVNQYPARSARGAVITVQRSAPAVGRVLVDYYTTNLFVTNAIFTNIINIASNPIARPILDYTPVSGTLVFDDYQMSANFVVPVSSPLTNVYFNVVLTNPRPAPEEDGTVIVPTIGPTNFATVQIMKINTTPRINFERTTWRADEYRSTPQGTTNVIIPGDNFINIDVIYPPGGPNVSATISVTSRRYIHPLLPGSDYIDPTGITFDNTLYTDGTPLVLNQEDVRTTTFNVSYGQGQTRDSFQIPIANDGVVEFNEDIYMEIVGTSPPGLAGLNRFATMTICYNNQPAGAADREWNPEGVVYTNPRFYNTPGANNTVNAVAVQPDQKTLLAGDFNSVNSFTRNHVARFNFDGSIDTTFNPGSGADGPVSSMILYPAGSTNAGKVLLGGLFSSYNGTSRNGLTRINANGTLDTSFSPGNGADGFVRALALQSDGKVIVAGDFAFFNNLNVNRIMRVNVDGSLDNTFNPGLGADASIWALALNESDPSNRVIYVAGEFTSFDGVTRNRIARLTETGALDLNFEPGLGANGAIYALAVQSNGQLVIGGAFGMYHTFQRSAIARLNADGSLDANYNVGTGFDDSVYALKLQPDGKALVGGIFTSFNTTRRMGLARLFTSGSLDTSFMDTAYNQFAGLPKTFSFNNPSFVNCIDLQTNGDLMIGGSFTNVGGNLSVNYPFEVFTSGSISGRTNAHNSGAHPSAPFTRQDKTTRFNIARIIGGYTLGPGNLEYDPNSQPFSIDENSGDLAVTLRRVDGRLGTAQVLPSTTNNTAVFPLDFSSSTSTQTWAEYNATINAVFVFSPISVGFVGNTYFNVPITDDLLQEGDETFGLIVSNAYGGITLGGEFIPLGAALGHADSGSAAISDNDFNKGEFNFAFAGYLVNESGLSAVISVIRTNGSSGTVNVDYRTRNGTAISPGDYTPASGTLRFVTGQTNATFTIPIFDGPEVEFDETVVLVLTNATGGAKLPGGLANSTITSTLTIIDDDFLGGRLQFSTDSYTNNENDVSAVVTVNRLGGNLGALTVQFQTLAGGTATAGADYVATNGVLVWADGESGSKTFTVPLLADGTVDGTESVFLRLSNPSQVGALGARTNATLWIEDGDAYGLFSFNQSFYEADENGSAPTITVLRGGGSAGTVSVAFATLPIIALPGVDYIETNGVLTFLPGEFSKTFTVPLIDNAAPDGDRSLQLILSSPVNGGLGAFTNVVLNIVDNESINTPAGSLDTTFSSLASANGAVYGLVRQMDGRLIMAGDFTQVTSVPRNRLARLKASGVLDTTFDIGPGANDSIRSLALTSEGKLLVGGLFTTINGTNRSRVARLSTDGTVDISFNPGAGADNPVFALIVQPNDKVLVGGSFSTFNNITRPGLVRLNTNGVVDASFTVGAGFNGTVYALALQNDGKVVVGGDFISFNGVARTNLVRLNANGSLDLSFDSSLSVGAAVRAIAVQPDGSIVIGGSFTNVNGVTRNHLARLDKNGLLDATFVAGGANSGADNTVYTIAQQIDGRLLVGGDFTIFNGVTRNGITRLYDLDGGTDPTINFGTGANGFVGALIIQPDRRIVLGGGFTEYNGQPRQHICRIYGGSIEGTGSLEFSAAHYVVSETSTNAIITVRRRGGTTGEVRVDAFTQDNTAVAGVDYLATANTLIFPEGETRRFLNVPILPNTTLDGNRIANLFLSGFVNTIPGPQPFAELLILDDEASLGFSSANFAANENSVGGNAIITLARTGATNTSASITIVTLTNGTATPFFDFIPTNAVVTFAPGEATRQFQVRVLNDALIEGNESIFLMLTNPVGTSALGITNAVLNLIDDETSNGQFVFATNNFIIDESLGGATVTVLRVNGSVGITSVRLITSNLTALAFLDYIPTNRVITFADGETSKSIVIPLVDDAEQEPTELFRVHLSQPTGGASIIGQNPATVSITDGDTGVIVGAGYLLVSESGPVNNLIDVGETVTVQLALRNASGSSFNNISAGLVYANGVTNPAPQVQNYGVLIAGGNSVSRPYTFTASGTNGGTVTATLLVTNSGVFVAAVSFDFVLGNTSIGFTNTNSIVIPASGPASPYPSTITISSVPGPVDKLTVQLKGVTHPYPADLDILLVAPNGTAVMLMSDAGTNLALNNRTFGFDDAAASALPQFTAINNGTYRPANYFPTSDSIPPFAPGTFWTNTTLASFNGINPNGVWSLYVMDDTAPDAGTIAGGWSLSIATSSPLVASADVGVAVKDTPDPVNVNNTVTYMVGVTNFGPATANAVAVTSLLPAGATFVSVSGAGSSTPPSGGVLTRSIGTLAAGVGVAFNVTMTAPATTGVLIYDATVTTSTSDLNGANNHLAINTTVFDSAPLPALTGAQKNSQYVLTWPGTATNLVLVCTPSILSGGWTNVPVAPVYTNGVTTVTLPLGSASQFYRLKRVP
jgi:uncharacterized repeat protein (TIGR01451 family)/uncharacterized delta-60 repeat protein